MSVLVAKRSVEAAARTVDELAHALAELSVETRRRLGTERIAVVRAYLVDAHAALCEDERRGDPRAHAHDCAHAAVAKVDTEEAADVACTCGWAPRMGRS